MSTNTIADVMLGGIQQHKRSLYALFREVEGRTGITRLTILGKNRTREVTRARAYIAWTLRRKMGWSYPLIGKLLERDHSTIMYLVDKVDEAVRRATFIVPKGTPTVEEQKLSQEISPKLSP